VSDLYKKMQAAYDRIAREAAAGVYGKRYVPAKDSEDEENSDNTSDFPYIEDPKGYTTHVPLESTSYLNEQGEEEEGPPEQQEAPPEEAGGAEGGEGEMPADAGGAEGDMGMDPNDPNAMAGGMPGMPEPLTSSQLGRVFELKKIYSRLASVETFLSRTTNEEMLEIRKLVGQSIDLFELVISNIPQYKEKIDEIIVTYYDFLNSVYGSLRTYFSEMSKEQKKCKDLI
jgi:hypothetical protein